MPESLVDPAVSRAKFDGEVAHYRELQSEYSRRGWWMLKADFPEVLVVLATPKPRPPAVVCGVLLDFSNYDLWAPSVKLVDPFTCVPYTYGSLPTNLPRRIAGGPSGPEAIFAQGLMQAHEAGDVPFLCLPGVREYHAHPAHSGDSWLLHRGRGEGSLCFLLEQIWKYGVDPVVGYQVGFTISLARNQVPE